MTARRLKGAWWVDFRFERERIRKKSPVDTKRGAEEYERVLRERLLRGEPLEGSTSTREERAGDFFDTFLKTYAQTENKPSERASKESIVALHLKPFFGEMALGEINESAIAQFKAQQVKKGLKAKTINNQLTVLRTALVCAREWKRLAAVPAIKWLKTDPSPFAFFTFEESERLLQATQREHYALVVTALKAGLRRGELLALRWEDVDFRAGKINVRRSSWRGEVTKPKGGRYREIPMSPALAMALKAHRHLRGELVFCNADGSPLTRDQIKRVVPSACKRAGLRILQWHALRHSFASQLVMNGVTLKAVQELLGHATLEMTLRYAHLAPSVHDAAVATLDGHQMGTERKAVG